MSQVISQPLLPRQHQKVNWLSVYAPANRQLIFVISFLAIHIPLGLIMSWVGAVAMVHAWVTVLCSLILVLRSRQFVTAAYAGAYIIGAEVLWRMTDSRFFWEGGKYTIACLFIIALLRRGLFRHITLPLIYFALLIPSALLTLSEMDVEESRAMLSFNLAGPLSLMVSVWYFSNVKFSREQFLRVLLLLVGPVMSIVSIGLFGTLTNADLTFNTESNYATSGGFGPNQVSSILGLAAFLALFYVLLSKQSLALKILMSLATLVFATQSALTFSRGGLYGAAGAAGVGCLYLMRDGRTRIKVLLIVGIVFVVGNYLVLPRLDSFTGGTLTERFQDTGASGRDLLLLSDISIWQDNPAFGVGPGMSRAIHAQSMHSTMSHTEFSRLVAEHGTLGFLAVLLLLVMTYLNLTRAPSALNKAIVASMTAWSFLYMSNAAMRTAAPSFIFGLSFAMVFLSNRIRPQRRPANMGNLKRPLPAGMRPQNYPGKTMIGSTVRDSRQIAE
jgi:hypothetical protein